MDLRCRDELGHNGPDARFSGSGQFRIEGSRPLAGDEGSDPSSPFPKRFPFALPVPPQGWAMTAQKPSTPFVSAGKVARLVTIVVVGVEKWNVQHIRESSTEGCCARSGRTCDQRSH